MANKIHQLSPLLISKIAAGEVIERPYFAVKELIENAIDAQATYIKISVEEAGLKKIQVVDNGEGMSSSDVQEAWKSHTTSKISEEAQLHAIKSYGFRGEALSSLAAVSTLTIRSKTSEDAAGFEVVVKEGKLEHASLVGLPSGTVIIAEHLFLNIPARKRFLTSPQTELRHILEVINHFAIAYPSIRFTFTHNKRTLLDYAVTKDISERVEQLVGNDIYQSFIPFKKEESYISISGFIAKPQINSSSQHKQFIFVNNRTVTNKLIATAVRESYGNMLESVRYPLFILFLTLPFEMVDVNVHPRKEQVAFTDSQFIFQTIKQVIGEVLTENNLTFQNLSWKRTGVGMTNSFAGKLLKKTLLDKESLEVDENETLVQLHKLYIVVSAKEGLILIDQHAAHERILFEKLQTEFIKQKGKTRSFKLFKPVELNLTIQEKILLEDSKKILEQLGFAFRKQQVTHLPYLFQDRNPKELISLLLEDIENNFGVKPIDKVSEEMLAFLACRSAVKAGDKLTDKQMKRIVKELDESPNNANCPHSRPTRIFISLDELNTFFKRR